MSIFSFPLQLLEILPKFKSPNSVLNKFFVKILLIIKDADELNMVNNLVNLSVGLKLAIEASPLEASDIQERLDVTQEILRDCMNVHAMDNERNVLLAVEDRHMRNRNYSENSHRARSFMQGPLMLCLQHSFLHILGTRQV